MTAAQFRKLALNLPESVESSHNGHPDFRVGGKIFATLGYPDDLSAAVMLDPGEQALFVRLSNSAFTPAAGVWGKRGSTILHLPSVRTSLVRSALEAAWSHRAPKRLMKDR